jgi:hypothetical protein
MEESQAHSSTEELMDHFGKETEVKTPVQKIESPQAPAAAQAPQQAVVETKKTYLPAETTAEIVIGSVDFTQQMVFEKIHRRKLKKRLEPFGGIDKAEELMDDLDAGRKTESDLSPDEKKMIRLMKHFNRITKEIAFTDEEYAKVKTPLSQIIKENGFDLPPNMAMFLVALEVIGPRIADAITE